MPKQDAIIQIINVNLEVIRELLDDKTSEYSLIDLDFSREQSLINDIETLLIQLQ